MIKKLVFILPFYVEIENIFRLTLQLDIKFQTQFNTFFGIVQSHCN